MKIQDRQSGYAALLSVLVLGAVSISASLILLVRSTDAQREALVAGHGAQARAMADTCAEEALQQIHANPSYTGTQTLSLSTYTCTYIVATTGTNAYSIAGSATIANVTRKVQVYAAIQSSQMIITSWQEVADF